MFFVTCEIIKATMRDWWWKPRFKWDAQKSSGEVESEKQSPRIGIVNHKTPVEALPKWPSYFLECFAKAERGNGGDHQLPGKNNQSCNVPHLLFKMRSVGMKSTCSMKTSECQCGFVNDHPSAVSQCMLHGILKRTARHSCCQHIPAYKYVQSSMLQRDLPCKMRCSLSLIQPHWAWKSRHFKPHLPCLFSFPRLPRLHENTEGLHGISHLSVRVDHMCILSEIT